MSKLIDSVIEQIESDVRNQDFTAIEEFLHIVLMYVPEKYLTDFLSEEKQNA
jgi:hypothetical protein